MWLQQSNCRNMVLSALRATWHNLNDTCSSPPQAARPPQLVARSAARCPLPEAIVNSYVGCHAKSEILLVWPPCTNRSSGGPSSASSALCSSPILCSAHTLRRRSAPHEARIVGLSGAQPICSKPYSEHTKHADPAADSLAACLMHPTAQAVGASAGDKNSCMSGHVRRATRLQLSRCKVGVQVQVRAHLEDLLAVRVHDVQALVQHAHVVQHN
jgi:hypothetical protein